MLTKLIELSISFILLAGLMAFYQIVPTFYALWIPVIILYTMIVSLMISLFGAALNVYYRDISQVLPVILSLLMYFSPVIYPLSLVKKKLLLEHSAGDYSELLYMIYMLNPLAGIIDGFQRTLLMGQPPDFNLMMPGFLLILFLLPISYIYFKRAENWFADVI